MTDRHRWSVALLLLAVATWPLLAQIRTPATVPNGPIRLTAELITPTGGAARKPAVVFAPGAGGMTIDEYTPGFVKRLLEEIFLPRDVAVLTLNKRGIGGSTGNWKTDSMETRASDVLAAVEYLRTLEGIDPERIGISGHSQGGWVVQLAGSLDPRVAFVISFAGPTVTVKEQDLRRTRFELSCASTDTTRIERGVRRRERFLGFMHSVGSWLPVSELRLMHNLLEYDPEPALRGLRQPTLLAFGELDDQAPPSDSLPRLDRIFPGGLPANLTVHVEPMADHYFREATSVCFDYVAALENPYRETFRAYLGAWVDRNL